MRGSSQNRPWKIAVGGVVALACLALTIGGCPFFEDEFAADAWLWSDAGWEGDGWTDAGWSSGDSGYNYSGDFGGIGSDGDTFYFIDGDSSYISP